MTTKPHDLFTYWTPDTAAECLDGVTPDLYRRLWSLVELLPRERYHVEESAPGDALDSRRGLAAVWSHLTEDERVTLNALAVEVDGPSR
jgi:hypothetical protein